MHYCKSEVTYKNRTLQYHFFKCIDAIPVADWNQVNAAKQLFLTLPYLKTLEDTLSETIEFRYLIFYENNTPVAIAVTQLLHLNTAQTKLSEFPCKVSDALYHQFFKNTDIKVLVCGNLFSCGEHGFMFSNDLSPQIAFKCLSEALQKIRRAEENKPSFILIKEFWPSSFKHSDQFKEDDFREIQIDVNMVVPIAPSWTTFEDYLGAMKTKFRSRAKKVFKKSAAVHVKDFTALDIAQYTDEINTCYVSVLDKAAFQIGKLNATTFHHLKVNLKDFFIFKGYFLDDKLVGFTTAFIIEDAIEANHIGLDYEYNSSNAIYQRMLYDYVQLSIDYKVKTLILGRTAETIKSSIGAVPIAMKLYVRYGNVISNTILKPLISTITPSEYEIRNPFKKIS